MQELLIVNPARRPAKRRKAASPAQKRARAAFAARARARSTAPKRRKARRTTSLSVMHNPIRKRRTHAKAVHRRRRHNPISLRSATSKPMALIAPALMGAIGATAVNTILAKLPIPATAMTGKMKYVTQGIAAIALGMIASKVGVKGATAARMAEGSLTVTLHQAIVDIAGGMGMNLSGVGYYMPGYGAGQAVPSASGSPAQLAGVGAYITGRGAPSNVVPMAANAGRGLRGFSRGF